MALARARAASSPFFSHILRSTICCRTLCSAAGSTDPVPDLDSFEARKKLLTQRMIDLGITSQVGICMPLAAMRVGMIIHGIEMRPGGGAQLVRAAGTCAKILRDPTQKYTLVQLPSKQNKLIDSRCRATVGIVSNPAHGSRKLRKAGENRWRGWRPVVRGVAMNAVDHPHGGGKGKSKSSGSFGRTSQTPWARPTKCGYKTARKKHKRRKMELI